MLKVDTRMVGKVGETSDDAVQGGDYGIDHRGRYDVNENVQDQRLNYVTYKDTDHELVYFLILSLIPPHYDDSTLCFLR